jgi:hypothetical protein
VQNVITEMQTVVSTDIHLTSLTVNRVLTSTHLANEFATSTVTLDPITKTECVLGKLFLLSTSDI